MMDEDGEESSQHVLFVLAAQFDQTRMCYLYLFYISETIIGLYIMAYLSTCLLNAAVCFSSFQSLIQPSISR